MPAQKQVTSARAYRVRVAKAGERTVYSIAIPDNIGEHIPEDTRFVPEWHEDGVLYRQVNATAGDVPEWVTNG